MHIRIFSKTISLSRHCSYLHGAHCPTHCVKLVISTQSQGVNLTFEFSPRDVSIFGIFSYIWYFFKKIEIIFTIDLSLSFPDT